MAARAETGVDIDTSLMPVREDGMTPYEILLSESQERMLVVAKAGHEQQVIDILNKWELEAAVIGQVTDDGLYRVRENGDVVCEIPGEPLVTGCPTYVREAREAEEVMTLRAWTPTEHEYALPHPARTLLRLLGSPNIASRAWIYDQYDTTVRTNTVIQPGGDAGVLRVRGTEKGIAAKVDCNARYVYLNPRRGAQIAVAEAARNVACVGARPRAITNNLNFGNPLKPEVYYQMREAVLGMGEACAAFDTPVTGGNVSLYNESPTGAIYPTPTVGMVGVLEDVSKHVRACFRDPLDAIVLLGSNTNELGGSEYLKVVHGKVAGDAPALDLQAERALQELMLQLADERLAHSAHDCAEGGLAVGIAESCIADGERLVGAHIQLTDSLPPAALLFGEAQGRIVISCAPGNAARVLSLAQRRNVPARQIGTVGEVNGRFQLAGAGATIDLAVSELSRVWREGIPRLMDSAKSAEI
jgi:phosphoribosylformylglycinamidine synthase